MEKLEIEFGRSTLSLETGRLAKQADGAVLVRYADTIVLTTAVASKEIVKQRSIPFVAHRPVAMAMDLLAL